MQKLLIELHYLPCIEYFCHLIKFRQIEIEANGFFEKQSYRSRCYILSANKIQMLSIPVKKHGVWFRQLTGHSKAHVTQNIKILYKDVVIDHDQKWVNNHWNSIRSAYGKAPYFEFYAEFFREILFKKIKYLFDLNIEMLDLCIKLLRVECGIEFTERFNKMPADNTYDMRNVIRPISNLSLRASGQVKGMERSNPQIRKSKYLFKPYHYTQLFGNKFAANLSIIDLLFCEGGDSLRVLQRSEIISES